LVLLDQAVIAVIDLKRTLRHLASNAVAPALPILNAGFVVIVLVLQRK
jgi:hypothetical protein